MIRHMFVFGVILPTLVTILLFVAFLVCWFKFNMRERLFSKRKLFSKQLKHAMAPCHASLSKQSHVYTADHTAPRHAGSAKDGTGAGGGSGAKCSISGSGVTISRKTRCYDNCAAEAEAEEDAHEHSVGDDPEAALCGACEDEALHARAQTMSGFSNPNLCASPTHSAADDEADDDDENEGGRRSGDARTEDHPEDHSDVEDHTDAETEYVQVKQVGSMFQHTFHFPASECSHLSNSLVGGDSEDGGSEDGSNYGHFVPLSHLLRDPKTRGQLYASSGSGPRAARPDSPVTTHPAPATTTAAMRGVSCTDTGRLITGM